jgi:hypothetical protein
LASNPVNLKAPVSSVLPAGQKTQVTLTSVQALRQSRALGPGIGNSLATDLSNLVQTVNNISQAAQQQQTLTSLFVLNPTGQVVAAVGSVAYEGVLYVNYFSEIHVGNQQNSVNPQNPQMAVFNANLDGSISVGNQGWFDVHDEFDGNAAWIGTQNDTLVITNAYNNGSGAIRLLVPNHTLATGNSATVKFLNLANVPNGNGTWTVTKIDGNQIDLQGSIWSGPFQAPVASAGIPTYQPTIDRVLQISNVTNDGGLFKITTSIAHGYESGTKVNIPSPGPVGNPNAVGQWIISVAVTLAVTGAVNNGSGLIRLTIPGGNYKTGDKVQILAVGGVPNANGNWTVTAISPTLIDLQTSNFLGTYTSGGTATFTNPNTFDLVGSTFAGTYLSGGTVLQYFAGMLAESIAIGPSFSNYKLRAFPSGDLRINNAEIQLTSSAGQITLNPNTAQITLTSATTLAEIVLDATVPSLTFYDQTGSPDVTLEILTETPLSVTVATNASPVVMTVPGCVTANPSGFPYVNGDTVFVAGATGNTTINGYRIIENVTNSNTFTMTDLSGNVINGNGALAGTVTCTRYFAGLLAQSLALGGNWNGYRLRFFADGRLVLHQASIDSSTITNSTISGSTFGGSFTSTAGTAPNVLTLIINNGVLSISGTGTEAGQGNITIDGTLAAATVTASGTLTGAAYKITTSGTTGAQITTLGTNAPAGIATLTPTTWIQITLSNGTQGYLPVWQ